MPEIDEIPKLLTPPDNSNLEELIKWQTKLRQSVDQHIASVLSQPFTQEFERRFVDDSLSRHDLSKWANELLRRTHLFLRFEEQPASFCCNRSRPEESGRLYAQILGREHRRSSLASPFQFELMGSANEEWVERTSRRAGVRGNGPDK